MINNVQDIILRNSQETSYTCKKSLKIPKG